MEFLTSVRIKELLQEKRLKPLKKLGQNFLVNPKLAETIANTVKKLPAPYVEIGPGLGALTVFFDKTRLLLIEKDRGLASYWRDQGFLVCSKDALKFDFSSQKSPCVLFGNLPYSLAGALIIKASSFPPISDMVFMMQKEVALRVRGRPSSKNYGLLSVISQVFWEVSLVGRADTRDFYPQPKVKGQVLRFRRLQSPDIPTETKQFISFVKSCFALRRKKLFKQIPSANVQKKEQALKNINRSLQVRAEELLPKDFVHLYRQISNS